MTAVIINTIGANKVPLVASEVSNRDFNINNNEKP